MKFLTPWALFLLLLAAMLPAAALPAAVPSPTQTVQQFLDARAAGQPDQAYALLSTPSHALLPVADFRQGNVFHEERADVDMPPSLRALANLIADTQDQSGYRFTVRGPAPGSPNIVLVSAQPPGGQAVIIKIATVPDAEQGGALRIDLNATINADPNIGGMRDQARMIASQSNLKQIALGIIQYCQDHDEKYPDAARWVDEIMPYVKNKLVFHDPSAPASEKWSYAFNRNLSYRSLAELDAPASTVAVFESTAGVKNTSDTGQSVPRPGRHQGGSDFGFADGHVKWLRDGTTLSFLLSGK